MDAQKKYWFPAKQYGWGWSFPTCWQGWAVFVAYAALLLFVRYFFPPAEDHIAFLAGIGLSTVGLLLVCWLKGEPPSWRWGQ
jgi:hypothetical protein